MTLFTKTMFATVALIVLGSAAMADSHTGGGWGGTGGGWGGTGEAVMSRVRTYQAGDAGADAMNAGVGMNRTGSSSTFADQELITKTDSNTLIGDPDCATCENNTTKVRQRVIQASGGFATQYSEGGSGAASSAHVQSGGATDMGVLVERYRTQTTPTAPAAPAN